MIRLRSILLATGIGLTILMAASARADEISLRPTARITPGADALLADIADLTGPVAEPLGATVIIPAAQLGSAWVRIDLDRVKAALDARGGITWGVLQLRGSTCSVGIKTEAAAMPAHEEPPSPGPGGQPASELGTSTVKGHIAARIAAALGANPDLLRLAFDERDSDLLAMTTAGRVIEARVTGLSDRLPVRVTVFEGERILVSRSVSVGVLMQRPVAVLGRDIRRGGVIGPNDFSAEDRWLGPAVGIVPPDQVGGAAAKASLAIGQIVTTNDIQPPVVIKRGDLVTVSCISGGVVVRTTARARSAARDGELLDLESVEPDRKARRKFTARASGRGTAVVAAGRADPGREIQP